MFQFYSNFHLLNISEFEEKCTTLYFFTARKQTEFGKNAWRCPR